MLGKTSICLFALALAVGRAFTHGEDAPTPATEVVISIAEQRLVVLRDGMWIAKHRVSTSKFGLGDSYGSYRTPLGKLRVCEKIGENFALGAVIKHRHATGEILPVNAPGRDPIVTRVLWLDGLEERNKNSKSRGIYIHGTVEESKIGSPVSYGCVRMKSREVASLFDLVPIGALVTIQTERLRSYRRWTPSEPVVVVAEKTAPPPGSSSEAAPLPKIAIASTRKSPAAQEKGVETRAKGKPVAQASSVGRGGRTAARTAVAATSEERPEPTPQREPGGGVAFKGSILFADIPPRGGKTGATDTLESIRGPVLAPVAERSRDEATSLPEPSPPMPRVTFRTGASSSTTVEREP